MILTKRQANSIECRHDSFQERLFQDGMHEVLEYLDVDYHIVRKGYNRYLKIESIEDDAE